MSEIKLTADSGGGTTSIKAPSTTTSNADVVLKLPVADGSANQVIKTDGSGQLSFTSNAGTTINNNADNRVITGSGTASTLEGEANLTFDGAGQLSIAHTDPKIALVDTSNNTDAYIFSDDNGSIRFQADQNSEASDTRIRFQTDGSERVSIDSELKIFNGNLFFGTSGKGVNFHTSNTGTANLLDDYETGNWTPDWRGASALGTTNYGSHNSASYVKVGNQVTVRGYSELNGSSGGSGLWFINNLPFTNGGGDDRRYRSVGTIALEHYSLPGHSDCVQLVAFIERNNNDMHIRAVRDNTTLSSNISVNTDDNFEVYFTITYQTT